MPKGTPSGHPVRELLRLLLAILQPAAMGMSRRKAAEKVSEAIKETGESFKSRFSLALSNGYRIGWIRKEILQGDCTLTLSQEGVKLLESPNFMMRFNERMRQLNREKAERQREREVEDNCDHEPCADPLEARATDAPPSVVDAVRVARSEREKIYRAAQYIKDQGGEVAARRYIDIVKTLQLPI